LALPEETPSVTSDEPTMARPEYSTMTASVGTFTGTPGGKGNDFFTKRINSHGTHNYQNHIKFSGIKVNVMPGKEIGFTAPGFGIFVGGDNLYWQMHEYGHYLQYLNKGGDSKSSGNVAAAFVNYYLYIGLPSSINMSLGIGGEHDSFFTETDANARAYLYFRNLFDQRTMSNFLELYPLRK